MEVIIRYGSSFPELMRVLSQNESIASVEDLGQGFGIVTGSDDILDFLSSNTLIEDAETAKNLYTQDIRAMTASCIRSAQNDNSLGLTGKGVIIGIIDTGIDFTHPVFRKTDGTTRLLSIWDQTAEGNAPEGFITGSEYTAEEINSYLSSAFSYDTLPAPDISGHGTAVAGIAAGASDSYTGAAPKADIIAVKVSSGRDDFTRSTSLMRGVRYISERARLYGRPAAINISFGMNRGAHRGNSLFEEYLSSAAYAWKNSIIVPTGNEGGAGHHYSGRLSSGETHTVEIFSAAGINGFYISLWKSFADDISVQLILPSGRGSIAADPLIPAKTAVFPDYTVFALYGQPTRYNAGQELFFEIEAENALIRPELFQLKLRAGDIADGRFDIWLPTVEEVTSGTYFANADNYAAMTIPSTSDKVISVSGYNQQIGSIAEFSGVGHADISLPIPTVAAPSVNITAPRAGGGYDSFTGTSFAAPFVTGTAALLMELGIVRGRSPFLYGEKLKAYIIKGALRSRALYYPDPFFGYGRLCAQNSALLI